MLFLIALLLAVPLSLLLQKPLRQHAPVFYGAAAVLSLLLGVLPLAEIPRWADFWLLGLFRRGVFSTAVWCMVMYAGALPKSTLKKCWMSIRGELSILAAILTLCHSIFYGKQYFVMLAVKPGSMTGFQLGAAIVSILLLAIMLPLTVMSFPAVRKRMKPKRWKSIQKTAYLFYGLLYLHILLILWPFAKAGRPQYILDIFLYSLVFLHYLLLKLTKARKKERFPVLPLLAAAVLSGVFTLPLLIPKAPPPPVETEPIGETAAAPAQQYRDGTYTGSADGYDGIITATVTVENGSISRIEATSQESDPWFFDKAMEPIVDRILENQDTQVDTVSSATCSSEGLIEAIEKALRQAK